MCYCETSCCHISDSRSHLCWRRFYLAVGPLRSTTCVWPCSLEIPLRTFLLVVAVITVVMLWLTCSCGLKQQHLIELIRSKDVAGALDFAQTHLAEKSEDCADIRSQLEQTLALLAFEEPESSPFGELMHLSQRQKVAIVINWLWWW